MRTDTHSATGTRSGTAHPRTAESIAGSLPTRRHLPAAARPGPATGTVLDVVVPVYNEEAGLASCVRRLHAFLTGTFPYGFRITIAGVAEAARSKARPTANPPESQSPGQARSAHRARCRRRRHGRAAQRQPGQRGGQRPAGEGSQQYTWAAAAIGSQNAASYPLSTGDPVMALGGFNGSAPSPTLDQFKEHVAAGSIHYLVGVPAPGRQAGQRAADQLLCVGELREGDGGQCHLLRPDQPKS